MIKDINDIKEGLYLQFSYDGVLDVITIFEAETVETLTTGFNTTYLRISKNNLFSSSKYLNFVTKRYKMHMTNNNLVHGDLYRINKESIALLVAFYNLKKKVD